MNPMHTIEPEPTFNEGIQLEIGKWYQIGSGARTRIGGLAVSHYDGDTPRFMPGIYWGLNANWYRYDGRFTNGGAPFFDTSPRDITGELDGYEYVVVRPLIRVPYTRQSYIRKAWYSDEVTFIDEAGNRISYADVGSVIESKVVPILDLGVARLAL